MNPNGFTVSCQVSEAINYHMDLVYLGLGLAITIWGVALYIANQTSIQNDRLMAMLKEISA